jgi:hypothetical protein
MASPQRIYQILYEPLYNKALQHSLNNLDRELAGQATNDPELSREECFLFHCYTACTSSAMKISQTISISTAFEYGGIRWLPCGRTGSMVAFSADSDASCEVLTSCPGGGRGANFYRAWILRMRSYFEVLLIWPSWLCLDDHGFSES